MIRPEQVWVAVEPVDMRLGIDGLSLKLQQALGRSPCDGSAYAFRNRNGTRIKLLIWDGTGVWLCHRRLHRGHFTWPSTECAVLALTATQWQWLITGIEWQRLSAVAPMHWRV
jgi:transposase